MYLKELCEACGWQGGTIHQLIAEIKRLKGIEAQAIKAIENLNEALKPTNR
jgi:hypothetical protein